MEKNLSSRVEREKNSHTSENNILEKSYALKNYFRDFWHNPALKRMNSFIESSCGDLHNKKVLDYGCGIGTEALLLVKKGAHVTGIDISPFYTAQAKQLMKVNQVTVECYEFHAMDGHQLKFSENTFDLVVGRGILHHLEYDIALNEIMRVLKPGGILVFQEPLGSNPLLKLFRLCTPYARTLDEAPLYRTDLKKIFATRCSESRYFGIICTPVALMTSFLTPRRLSKWILFGADKVEVWLNKLTFLHAWNQYIVLVIRK